MLFCSTHLSRCLHPFQIPCKLPLLFHDSAQKSLPLSCPHSQPHHRSPAISNLACITIICIFCLPNWFNFSNTAFLYFPVSLNFETILWGRCQPPYYMGKRRDRPRCPHTAHERTPVQVHQLKPVYFPRLFFPLPEAASMTVSYEKMGQSLGLNPP